MLPVFTPKIFRAANMHPSLQFTKLRFLPPQIKLHAKALYAGNGSADDFASLGHFIAQAPDDLAQYTLPVFYALLDPAPISTEDLDIAAVSPATAALCFRSLCVLGNSPKIAFSRGVAKDIWPRIWAWLDFLSTYGAAVPGLDSSSEPHTLLAGFLLLEKFAADPDMHRVIRMNPRTLFFCTYAARRIPDQRPQPFRLLVDLFSHDDIMDGRERVSAIVEGADGYASLAALLCYTCDVELHAFEESRLLDGALHYYDCLRVLRNIDPTLSLTKDVALRSQTTPRRLSEFAAALVSRGIIESISDFCFSLATYKIPGTEHVATAALCVLLRLMSTPPGHVQAREASRGLAEALVWLASQLGSSSSGSIHGARQAQEDLEEVIKCYFTTILPPFLMRFAFLDALDGGKEHRAHADVVEQLSSTPGLKGWSLYDEVWVPFEELLRDRVAALWWYLSDKRVARRMCDNLNCGKIGEKAEFKKCSGCSTFCYCSAECEREDWKAGGHKNACFSYESLRLHNQSLELTMREKSFLHGLLGWDWSLGEQQIKIAALTAKSKRSRAQLQPVGEDVFTVTLYDYSKGRVSLDFDYPNSPSEFIGTLARAGVFASTVPVGAGVALQDMVHRAKASRGAISIAVVAFACGVVGHGGSRKAFVALQRSSQSTFSTMEKIHKAHAEMKSEVDYLRQAFEIAREEKVEFHA
ncbi:hypothetical protein C8F01DRAFT_1251421 [Mycena amicta]|nr:hypothetical protein C8F01DRAFT_1251421 [Mycena amicta]